MEANEKTEEPKHSRIKILIIALVAATIGLAGWGVYQHQELADANKRIALLEATQQPQTLYDSYEDCTNNGGAPLITFNAGFAGCLGGNMDETGELAQYQAFLQYSAQNLPRVSERKSNETPNKVTAEGNYSADLISFLELDYTGCEPRGEYEIVKEVKDRFAKMKYGCEGDGQVQSDDPPYIIAMKLADGWVLLSPTNNFDEEGRPSCLVVDMFKVSKELEEQCYENTGYNNGSLKDVIYP